MGAESWGYIIRWGSLELGANGFSTYEQMEKSRQASFDLLAVDGWTQPRWWQFWRSRDTRR